MVTKPLSLSSFPGSGMGLVTSMVSLVIVMYFQRYRGIAMGINYVGVTLSALFTPQVVLYLKDMYGYRGVLLIFGALSMHVTAASILLKEPPWASDKKTTFKVEQTPEDDDVETSLEASLSHPQSKLGTLSNQKVVQRASKLFRSPYFYALLIACVLTEFTINTFVTTVVDFGLDKGFSMSESDCSNHCEFHGNFTLTQEGGIKREYL